jgi:hypothetical protein
MNAISLLIGVSALGGLALGLFRLHWGVLPIVGVILAIAAAAVLQNGGFDFIPGVAIIVGCLTANQFAYLVGAALTISAWHDAEPALTGDPDDEPPRQSSQNDVTGEHNQHNETPPRSHLPNH